MARTIEHKPDQQRFEYTEDALTSHIEYKLTDGVMVINHTSVPAPLGGRGIAADLTRAALDTARHEGWQVDPVCTYAQSFIRRHKEYQDLLG